jgi:hypothetical protein
MYLFKATITLSYPRTDCKEQNFQCDFLHRHLTTVADSLNVDMSWDDSYVQPEGWCEANNAYYRIDTVVLTKSFYKENNVSDCHSLFFSLLRMITSTGAATFSYQAE